MAKLPVFEMPFEPMTINHLGLRLYSSLPPVISELVSNAYDAESASVAITLPVGDISQSSEVVVQDWGHGMSPEELQTAYLPIGRNRRGVDNKNTKSKNKKRTVLGRKGLGKLSAFGVAKEMEVRSVKSRQAVCLRLNYDEMLDWAAKHSPSEPYRPEVVHARTGSTTDKDGVEIRLRHLRRSSPINADELRRGIARRLYVIGKEFKISVNGVPVTLSDRLKRSECDQGFSWDVSDVPAGATIAKGYVVRGWIGFTRTSSQIGRGVNVIANGKSVELGSFFNYPSTHVQFARAHFAGEVHADFLDGVDDNISTARDSVVWETEIGQSLEKWGHEAIRWAFEQWLSLRSKEKSNAVVKAAGFDTWLQGRPSREQKIAKRMVKLLVDDPKIETESAVPLLEIIKSSVESVFFHDMVDALSDQGADAATLLALFHEWRIIEARSMLQLADGRIEAMDRLRTYVDAGALEVQQLQPLLEENLWLLNPKWTEADGQTTYTDLLRKHCKESSKTPERDRRLDILGVSAGSALTIVEIKRPEKTLSRSDLQQVAEYVDWARTNFEGNGPHSPKYISGLLIVGKLSQAAEVQREMKRLAADDIRVETFRDLHTAAREYYGHSKKVLKHIAPEYVRARSSGTKATSKGARKTTRKKKQGRRRTRN